MTPPPGDRYNAPILTPCGQLHHTFLLSSPTSCSCLPFPFFLYLLVSTTSFPFFPPPLSSFHPPEFSFSRRRACPPGPSRLPHPWCPPPPLIPQNSLQKVEHQFIINEGSSVVNGGRKTNFCAPWILLLFWFYSRPGTSSTEVKLIRFNKSETFTS